MRARALLLPVIAVQAFEPSQVLLKTSDSNNQGPRGRMLKQRPQQQVPLKLAQQ